MISPCPAVRKLESRMDACGSLLCVGLDPELPLLPTRLRSSATPLFDFCREIIDSTAEFACAFKPNTAFFEAHGAAGWQQLTMVFRYLRDKYPTLWTIADAKRGDNANTSRGYVKAIYDELGADAVTLHPYLGSEALQPFLARTDRAAILLCRTSNVGARELQDLLVDGKPLWQHVARLVSCQWNAHGNCMLVVGATYPAEIASIRGLAPEMTFLVPGVGAQGGDIDATLSAGLRADGKGLVVSSSRAILYAEDPAAVARATRDALHAARKRHHGQQ